MRLIFTGLLNVNIFRLSCLKMAEKPRKWYSSCENSVSNEIAPNTKFRVRWFNEKPHMNLAMEMLGWIALPDDEAQSKLVDSPANIYWHDDYCVFQYYENLRCPHAISKIPGLKKLCTKVEFTKIIHEMEQKSLTFYPKTWILPNQLSEFLEYDRSAPGQLYIMKPDGGKKGIGIEIIHEAAKLRAESVEPCIVQEYLKSPMLLDGFKFDIRLYTVITNTNKPEIYLCKEGLTRLCSRKYELRSDEQDFNPFVHLTNFFLNSQSPSFERTDRLDTGSKRTWSSVKEKLSSSGHDFDSCMKEIEDISRNVLLAVISKLHCRTDDIYDLPYSRCFQIVGLDFLFDSNMRPYLLEINQAASVRVAQPIRPDQPDEKYIDQVDAKVKIPLITDTLKLVAYGEDSLDSQSCLERIYPPVGEELSGGLAKDIQNFPKS